MIGYAAALIFMQSATAFHANLDTAAKCNFMQTSAITFTLR